MGINKLFSDGVPVCGEKFLLKVSKDRLEATVSPKDAHALARLTGEDFAQILTEAPPNGVTFGLLEGPELKSPGIYFVAKGQPVIHGENAKIRTYVKPAVVRSPKVKNSSKDNVDFRELGSIVNVPKDKLLLEKVLPTAGVSGKTVTSQIIKAKPGKDIKIRIGSGVRISEDGMQVHSEIEGKYILGDGKASVLDSHLVNGDIDISVGNVAFVGKKLEINGSVLPGFKVKCKKDIYIAQGVQNSAEIVAGGDLSVKGGTIGSDVVIQCWGCATIDFIENVGRIEVKGDLIITDAIIQGHARVGNDLFVAKGKGTLIGGSFIVGGSAYITELGSDGEVVTEISVGINPKLEEKKKKLHEDKEIWPVKMNEVIKNTTALKKQQREMGKEFPPEKLELLKQCNESLPQIMEKVNSLNELEKDLEAEIEETISACIYVYGKVYPGVHVEIGGISRTLVSEEQCVVIHFDKHSRSIRCRSMTPEEREAKPQ